MIIAENQKIIVGDGVTILAYFLKMESMHTFILCMTSLKIVELTGNHAKYYTSFEATSRITFTISCFKLRCYQVAVKKISFNYL